MNKDISTNTKKKRVNYTIDIGLLKDFKTATEERSINKSSLIESFIKRWFEENGIKR